MRLVSYTRWYRVVGNAVLLLFKRTLNIKNVLYCILYCSSTVVFTALLQYSKQLIYYSIVNNTIRNSTERINEMEFRQNKYQYYLGVIVTSYLQTS